MQANALMDEQQAPEDYLRSRTYALLSALFARTPTPDLLAPLATLDVDEQAGPLAEGWRGMADAAGRCQQDDLEALDIEYHDLFIGIGRGELMPYGSWYQTGFLMGRPLVKLRDDLKALGLEREAEVYEPEDHISALFDSMAILSGPDGVSVAGQRVFFNDHLASWVERFMQDLQKAKSAVFYRSVGAFAERFIVAEKQYLEMA
ncbi:molecular chaperone TorD [Spiribacter sp. C176]|uniref:Molecular chaperone TorD n=1 Tax=Spiribacter salilacus TaxID=2664894 RepID=A0A6N7QVK1_9GAMM|nr:molecular chaperone TorD family protein [Spiribacter salilacus]MRH78347.1 molecular chaperone TorD [Spiribacter salilacus]